MSSMEVMQQDLQLLYSFSETDTVRDGDRVIYPLSHERDKQADRAVHNIRLSLGCLMEMSSVVSL